MLQSTSSINTRKGQNALAKVQRQNRECTPAKRCNRKIWTYNLPQEGAIAGEERRSLPERAEKMLQKALVEGGV